MLNELQALVAKQVIRPLDYQFARYLAADVPTPQGPLLALVAAMTSFAAGSGHICLDLRHIQPQRLFGLRDSHRLWQASGALPVADWPALLRRCPAVGNGSQPTPLVLDGHYLYLHRLWQDEGQIIAFLQRSVQQTARLQQQTAIAPLRSMLDTLFVRSASAEQEVDWQKTAAALACHSAMAVISGGPGTGKTTTVTRMLAALLLQAGEQKLRIRLVAPTGKAAARLSESISAARATLPVPPAIRERIPAEAGTLHRLLGAQPNSSRFRYHRDNRLHLDLLVVDEASMVDVSLMARLVEALPEHARLILLGDRDQLASVEAGAILGDICQLTLQGYSPEQAERLGALTGSDLSAYVQTHGEALRDQICLLRKSYRFAAGSGIGRLAAAVNQGDVAGVQALLGDPLASDDLHYRTLDEQEYPQLLRQCVTGYRPYLLAVRSLLDTLAMPEDVVDTESSSTAAEPLSSLESNAVRRILHQFAAFQLLCALREGQFGVSGLNQRIEQSLEQAGLIRRDEQSRWYPGRPVMIMQNDSALGLFNGDIGITLEDYDRQGKRRLRVWFEMPNGSVRAYLTSRLPAHETVYAMTVHKSQGSEFAHTLLVLPPRYTPLLTRELVYTAITRAKQQLSLYATSSVLLRAVQTRTQRHSGFAERLQRGS